MQVRRHLQVSAQLVAAAVQLVRAGLATAAPVHMAHVIGDMTGRTGQACPRCLRSSPALVFINANARCIRSCHHLGHVLVVAVGPLREDSRTCCVAALLHTTSA